MTYNQASRILDEALAAIDKGRIGILPKGHPDIPLRRAAIQQFQENTRKLDKHFSPRVRHLYLDVDDSTLDMAADDPFCDDGFGQYRADT